MSAQSLASRWARSGLMFLTGTADRPAPLDAARCLAGFDHLAGTFMALSEQVGRAVAIDESILTERAAIMGVSRHGAISCNGNCRLMTARDGIVAVNLPRAEDWDSLPAWLDMASLEMDSGTENWAGVEKVVASKSMQHLLTRAELLGLPVAALPDAAPDQSPLAELLETVKNKPHVSSPWTEKPPLVIDLSTIWAGPLAGHLLARAGARVVKVECKRRPDTIRDSTPDHFDRLNHDKQSVMLDFTDADDRAALRRLVHNADIVISSARARAMDMLGLWPLPDKPLWVAITAHGLTGTNANRVGFGDDCAVAGGLVARDENGRTIFLGDAIADPLTGITAAIAAISGYSRGRTGVLDVALAAVASHVASMAKKHPPISAEMARTSDGWAVRDGPTWTAMTPPNRPRKGPAAPLPGLHTKDCIS